MDIIKIFLDNTNNVMIGEESIGTMISSRKYDHLWENRCSANIDTIVIHYISAVELHQSDPFNINRILSILVTYGVSSHYLIDRTGKIYNLVPESKKAWHCGLSIMPEPDNRRGVNDFSIGIELVATNKSGYTLAQYDALANLSNDILLRYDIKNYVGHEDIAGDRAVSMGVRRDKKSDPGELFDWNRYYESINLKR